MHFISGAVCIALLVSATALRAEAPSSLPPAPVEFESMPWTDGEALSYCVSWSGLDAARGTFTARKKSGHWEFKLSLASSGLVNDFYPFTGTFWSILLPSPWRSVQYGEYRYEPRRDIMERTQIDYAGHLGTREVWSDGRTTTFPIAEQSVDDVGTMLYHLRAIRWKPGDKYLLHVYESDSEKEALTECQTREIRAFGSWPSQPLLRIQALPGKGTHHRGGLTIWVTDDARRLPVHADLNFRYGSFAIDLTSAR